ncbi:hypothetical protein L083_1584 [Actinoplanes sp. N902-109]|nr:hypothetical protein L083_1584 [Actinoplanes sp. N902-109]
MASLSNTCRNWASTFTNGASYRLPATAARSPVTMSGVDCRQPRYEETNPFRRVVISLINGSPVPPGPVTTPPDHAYDRADQSCRTRRPSVPNGDPEKVTGLVLSGVDVAELDEIGC